MPTFRPDERDLTSVEPDRHQSMAGRQTLGEPTRRRQALHEPTRPTTYRTLRTSARLNRHVSYKSAVHCEHAAGVDMWQTSIEVILTARDGTGQQVTESSKARTVPSAQVAPRHSVPSDERPVTVAPVRSASVRSTSMKVTPSSSASRRSAPSSAEL